ncbi:MAG TPA: hypothetical protein VJ692_12975 [Nitrospiraceae bacterium]|nr:hypothetical protein [Nitrospiraceae bacterium]
MPVDPSLLAAATAFESAQSITADQGVIVLARGLEMMARALDQRLKSIEAAIETVAIDSDADLQ